MEKRNYNLRDRGYFKLLQIVAEGLDFQEVDYALVGGSAVQVRIAHAMNSYEGMTIPDIPEPMLRRTKDFDITTHSSEVELANFLNLLQVEHEPLTIKPTQPRRVVLTYPSGNGRNTAPVSVVLNYQTGPQDFSGLSDRFYNECLNTAEELHLDYKNEGLMVRVATPECIIASKLTRYSAKDVVDISGLLRVLDSYEEKGAKPFNYDLIKQYLQEARKEHCFDRLNNIATEVLKE